MRGNQACLKRAAGRKKCLRQRFHLSLALGRSSWRINAVCRAILAFCRAVSHTQSLSAICHYACRWWWHWYPHAMYRILAAYTEWIEGYHNYDSGMNETLSTEMNTPLLMNLRLMITVIKILRQLYITRL